MAKTPRIRKGKATIVKHGEAPGGDCQSKDCPVNNPEIIAGMIVVECEGKTYHGGCAAREKINFVPPSPKKIKRGKEG